MAEAIVSATAAAVPPPAAPSFSYLAVFSNCPLVAAVLAFAIAQSIKVLTTWYKENRWDAKQLVGSGGMPSSHSATVTALAVAVGLQEGFASSLFATAAVFASVVMYDAFGVRLHAGKQAEALAEQLFDSEKTLIQFDMSEYVGSHSVLRLVGAPPSYLGHEDGGQLTEKISSLMTVC